VALNGVALNGVALNGVALNGVALNGIPLTTEQADDVETAMILLGECALTPQQSFTITDLDGNVSSPYYGQEGLDPGRATGTSDPDQLDAIDQCMVDRGRALGHIVSNGVALNGVALNGVALNGVALNGVALNGIALQSIALNDVTLGGNQLTVAQAGEVKDAVILMAECALLPQQSITISNLDGTSDTYYGDAGHDPGRASGAADLDQLAVMGECVMNRGSALGYPMTYDPSVARQAFLTILEYLVGCALPHDRTVTVVDEDNNAIPLSGAIGLAPDWETRPATPAEQRLVSACLAARTNASGKSVQISLRGAGLLVSKLETVRFAQHEGAFVADLFGTNPYVKSCNVLGGITGRTCASEASTCGFETLNDCTSVCTDSSEPGTYSQCGGHTEVISTFLALDHSIASGFEHTCIRQLDGTVDCWGSNQGGQLGTGSFDTEPVEVPQTIAVSQNRIDSLTSRYLHTCARDAKGELTCWGQNFSGQLGDGTNTAQPAPVAVASDVAQLSAGNENTCAIAATGELSCWGANGYGQIGDGTTTARNTPVSVPGLSRVIKVATGYHTCALDGSGSVYCWGHNNRGQVGAGATPSQLMPIEVPIGPAIDLCIGYEHTCAVLESGVVNCWGRNIKGQLGDGSTNDSSTPGAVDSALPTNATGVACGYRHTCARLEDGSLWCWGYNGYGQVGMGSKTEIEATPREVIGIAGVRDVVPGYYNTCAEIDDGSMWCWGANDHRQLGTGCPEDSVAPTAMIQYVCGNRVCETGETPRTCAADCIACGNDVCSVGGPSCGNGQCESGEDSISCQSDCGLCGAPGCGDGICDPAAEDCQSCAQDCGECPVCAGADEYCTQNNQCCSGRCRKKKNKCRA
ncbi:MAG: hypothetical protein MJE77_35450, partial [Proteobacteria bacterium]|nr:hypothetical protein [Pseudomonadota bacterium]